MNGIQHVTGIKKRHFANESDASSDFAIKASIDALKDAKIDPKDIDLSSWYCIHLYVLSFNSMYCSKCSWLCLMQLP
jgi:hypothetical protein